MKTEHWIFAGIGLTCLFILATCDGGDDSEVEKVYEYEEYSNENSYIICVLII